MSDHRRRSSASSSFFARRVSSTTFTSISTRVSENSNGRGVLSSAVARVLGGKHSAKVLIDDYNPQQVYSQFDEIKGFVEFVPNSPVEIEKVNILLKGTTTTWIATMDYTNRTTATHKFLQVACPVEEIPQGPVDGPISFPFTFIVPPHILATACGCDSDVPHTSLPPSVNDQKVIPTAGADLLPEMTKVEYIVKIQFVLLGYEKDRSLIIEDEKHVRIMPTMDGDEYATPPSFTEEQGRQELYTIEKSLKKGIFGKKDGQIVVQTTTPGQPTLLTLAHDEPSKTQYTNSIPLSLSYFPSTEKPSTLTTGSLPPALTSIEVNLESRMRYAVKKLSLAGSGTTDPYNAFGKRESNWATKHTVYRTNSAGSGACAWTASLVNNYFGDVATGHGRQYGHGGYTAKMNIPIPLPMLGKILIPSFVGCLMERTYAVEIKLGFAGRNTVILKLPVTISAIKAREGGMCRPRRCSAGISDFPIYESGESSTEDEGGGEDQGGGGSRRGESESLLRTYGRSQTAPEERGALPPSYRPPVNRGVVTKATEIGLGIAAAAE
ncbi:hypothetical protein YB2330_001587 [Saitoella coloradoensis]